MMLRGVVALLGVCLLASCDSSSFDPPRRLGPPALVMHEGEPRLWLMVKQEEEKQRRFGGSRRWASSWVTETYYHFELQWHDSRTTERLWKKRLLTLKDDKGGHNAEARILGQDGNVVWLYLHDGPVAVSAGDASVLADRAQLEQRNSSLQGLLAKELKFYTYDNGLVITSADSRLYKVRVSDYAVEPYKPASDDHFRSVQFMSSQWNGGYNNVDFMTRQIMLGSRWFGFYTEKEAADAGDDRFGDTLKNPDSVIPEGSRARRTFWTARIGKTKEFSEGSHDRVFDITRVPGAPDFLEAGLLIQQGTKKPLMLADPESFLVLHRTRLDAEGRLALTRLDTDLRPRWTATLPFIQLQNRFQFPDRLLMYGSVQVTEKGATDWQELIAALDLRDGGTRVWNVTRERSVPATELEKAR